ncbi:hypothetical protein [Glutamicibacter uratoxydans]|uniref:hypothetical protein n=1 Tax=Glutamicibacter uratoxydans TaxID=43667 RepID=UPI003D6E0099
MKRSVVMLRVTALCLGIGCWLWVFSRYLLIPAGQRGTAQLADLVLGLVVGALIVVLAWFVTRRRVPPQDNYSELATGVGTLISAQPTGRNEKNLRQLELVIEVHAADGKNFPARITESFNAAAARRMLPGVLIPLSFLSDHRIIYALDAEDEESNNEPRR